MDALINAVTEAAAKQTNTSIETKPNPETTNAEAIIPGAETPEQKPGETISPRMAAIIKREGSLVKRERELKDKQLEMEKSFTGKLSREDLMKDLMNEFEEDPYEFMSKNGFSYERLQNHLLQGDDGKKLTKLEKTIFDLKAELKAEKDAKLSEQEQSEQSEYDGKRTEAISRIETELKDLEDFELVSKEGAYQLVYDVILEHYQETKKILSIKEAGGMVEKHLEDDFKKRLEYGKVKKWMSPQDSSSKSLSSEQLSPKPSETKTITSDMIPGSSETKSDLDLTDDERMAKAIRQMRGEKV